MSETTNTPTDLENMLDVSNARATYYNQLRLAGIKFANVCHFGFQGGSFQLTAEFLGYLDARLRLGATKAVVLDSSQMPVMIEDLKRFYDQASGVYHEGLNDFYDETQRLRTARRVHPMMEIASE